MSTHEIDLNKTMDRLDQLLTADPSLFGNLHTVEQAILQTHSHILAVPEEVLIQVVRLMLEVLTEGDHDRIVRVAGHSPERELAARAEAAAVIAKAKGQVH